MNLGNAPIGFQIFSKAGFMVHVWVEWFTTITALVKKQIAVISGGTGVSVDSSIPTAPIVSITGKLVMLNAHPANPSTGYMIYSMSNGITDGVYLLGSTGSPIILYEVHI